MRAGRQLAYAADGRADGRAHGQADGQAHGQTDAAPDYQADGEADDEAVPDVRRADHPGPLSPGAATKTRTTSSA